MLYAISQNTCMLHNSLKNFAAKETTNTQNALVALEQQNKILSQMAKQNILNSQLLLTKIGENTISIENLVHSTLSVSETVYNYYLKNSFQLLIEKPFIF